MNCPYYNGDHFKILKTQNTKIEHNSETITSESNENPLLKNTIDVNITHN